MNAFDSRGYITLKTCASISKWLKQELDLQSVECHKTDTFLVITFTKKSGESDRFKIRCHTIYLLRKEQFDEFFRSFEPYNKTIELNFDGKAIWRHNEIPNIFLERSYRWVDLAMIIDENSGGRLVIATKKFSEISLDNWVPIQYDEYQRMICQACKPDKTCDDCKWPGC